MFGQLIQSEVVRIDPQAPPDYFASLAPTTEMQIGQSQLMDGHYVFRLDFEGGKAMPDATFQIIL